MKAPQLVRGRTARRIVLAAALIGALVCLCLHARVWRKVEWGTVGTYDFVAYWSAAKLLRQGGDPYDPKALLPWQQQVGWPYNEANRFWYAPWTLILIVPTALLPFGLAAMGWTLLQIVVIVSSGMLLWGYFAPEGKHPWLGLLVAVGFFPCFSAINMGQISPFLLAGVVGFLWAERKTRDLAGGAALALLMIKPHVTYLFWPAAVWWAWQSGRRRVLLGWIGVLVGASGVTLVVSPTVFRDYAGAVALPPWATPNIGVWLRVIFGVDRLWLQFLPSLLGGLGLLAWLLGRRGPWRWEHLAPPLVLISVVTATFGWSYDQVVLLPAVVALVVTFWEKRVVGRVVILLLLIGAEFGLVAMSHWGVPDAYAVWHAPLVGALYWWSATRGLRIARVRDWVGGIGHRSVSNAEVGVVGVGRAGDRIGRSAGED